MCHKRPFSCSKGLVTKQGDMYLLSMYIDSIDWAMEPSIASQYHRKLHSLKPGFASLCRSWIDNTIHFSNRKFHRPWHQIHRVCPGSKPWMTSIPAIQSWLHLAPNYVPVYTSFHIYPVMHCSVPPPNDDRTRTSIIRLLTYLSTRTTRWTTGQNKHKQNIKNTPQNSKQKQSKVITKRSKA